MSPNLYTNHLNLIMYHKSACCINNESHMWYSIIVLTAPKSTMCSLCTTCVMLINVTPSNCIMTGQRQVMSFEQHCECHCHGTFATLVPLRNISLLHVMSQPLQLSSKASSPLSGVMASACSIRCVCHKSPKSTDTLSSSLAATSVMLSAGYRMQ